MKSKILLLLSILVLSCSKESETPTPPDPVIKFTLTVSAGEGGSISSNGGQYEKGSSVTITATPDSGYVFDKWSDGNTDNPRTINIHSNLTLIANFSLECTATYYESQNLQRNSYAQRFIYHHKHIYEILGQIDSDHGDHVINYGTNSISADYNNDGYLDFISYYSDYAIEDDRRYVKFFLNDCNNNLVFDENNSGKFYGLVHGRKLIQGDYNSDGYIDLLLIGHGWDHPPFPGEYPVILFGNSDGIFSESRLTSFNGTFHSGASGDLDNDGDLDVILTSGPENSPILLNDGQGNFTESQMISNHNKGTSRYTTEIFDINDDGFEDIIIGGGENQDWTLSDGVIDSPPIIYYGPNYDENILILPNPNINYSVVLDIGIIDLNADNLNEILLLRTNNYQGWHIQVLSLSNGEYIDQTEEFIELNFGEGQPFYWMFIGDFDGDGTTELVSEWDPEISWKYPFYHRWDLINGKFIKSE